MGEEGFERFDNVKERHFAQVENHFLQNDAVQALMRFKAYCMASHPIEIRPTTKVDSPEWITTQFFVRVNSSAALRGEPALEGVHKDGVEYVMTTFLGSKNMRGDSAVTYIHELEQETGLAWNEVDRRHIRGVAQHSNFLDTLLFLDRRVKHSVSSLFQKNRMEPAHRDILLLFTRKPGRPTWHPSAQNDSMKSHRKKPFEFDLSHRFMGNQGGILNHEKTTN